MRPNTYSEFSSFVRFSTKESFINNIRDSDVNFCNDTFAAFDAVDHSIILKKLKLYGVTDNNNGWVKS